MNSDRAELEFEVNRLEIMLETRDELIKSLQETNLELEENLLKLKEEDYEKKQIIEKLTKQIKRVQDRLSDLVWELDT